MVKKSGEIFTTPQISMCRLVGIAFVDHATAYTHYCFTRKYETGYDPLEFIILYCVQCAYRMVVVYTHHTFSHRFYNFS